MNFDESVRQLRRVAVALVCITCVAAAAPAYGQTRTVLRAGFSGDSMPEILVDWEDSSGAEVIYIGDVNGGGRDDIMLRVPELIDAGAPGYSALIWGETLPAESARLADIGYTRFLHGDIDSGFYPAGCGGERPYAPAGDLDGDGYDDFFVGSCSTDFESRSNTGLALIVFGAPDYPDVVAFEDLAAASIRSKRFITREEGVAAGKSVTLAGDLNDDGRPELAISGVKARGIVNGERFGGRVWIVDGALEAEGDVQLDDVGTTLPGLILDAAYGHDSSHQNGDRLGSALSPAGDVNGDGVDDFLVAAHRATRDGAPRQAGVVYVVYGSRSFGGRFDVTSPEDFGVEIIGDVQDAYFGSSLAELGDVDDDGFDDFAVGMPGDTGGQGEAFIVFGSPSSASRAPITELRTFRISGEAPSFDLDDKNTYLGGSVAGLGDIDHDSFPDVFVGAPNQQFELGTNVGAGYVIFGSDGLPAQAMDRDVGTSALPGIAVFGDRIFGRFGQRADSGGDVDGDGEPDLIIVSSYRPPGEREHEDSSIRIVRSSAFPPTGLRVEGVEPAVGSIDGDFFAVVHGFGFFGAEQVRFGSAVAEVIETPTSAEILVRVPGAATPRSVAVEVRRGGDVDVLEAAFEYVERPKYADIGLDHESLETGPWRTLRIEDDTWPALTFSRRGFAGCYAADVDGDEIDDLIVGSIFESSSAFGGEVLVVFGRHRFAETIRWGVGDGQAVIRRDDDWIEYGRTIALPGDLDGDRLGDIVVGGAVTTEPVNPFSPEGRAYVLRGRELWEPLSDIPFETSEGLAIPIDVPACAHPVVASIGAIAGDGRDAFAIGSGTLCRGSAARVRIFFEQPGFAAEEPDIVIRGDNAQIEISGSSYARGFGTAMAPAGDMNGDGVDDFAIGAPHALGAVYIVLGGAWTSADMTIGALKRAGRAILVTQPYGPNEIGLALAPAGDFNGDGLADLLIGDRLGGVDEHGAVHVLLGSRRLGSTTRDIDLLDPAASIVRIVGAWPRDRAGEVSGLGDWNGDGFDDVGIVPYALRDQRARAYVVLGEASSPRQIELRSLGARGFRILGGESHWFSSGHAAMVATDLDADGSRDIAIGEMTPAGKRVIVIFGEGDVVERTFVRGEINSEDPVNLSDAIWVLGYLFLGYTEPECLDAADVDDSGSVELTDGIYLLNFLFLGGPEPPAPYPAAGTDPTPDDVGC